MRKLILALFLAVILPAMAQADQGYPYPEMQVHKTGKNFKDLIGALKASIKTNKMLLVSSACGSCGAKNQGFTIPGNYVAGVFRNDFARRAFAAHVEAGIEFPIRFYITENADKTATLTYRLPSAMLGPYGNATLDEIGAELDIVFAAIAEGAVQ